MSFLAFPPISALAEGKAAPPDRNGLLAPLQRALGKAWSVAIIPEGYLLTYAQPVILYNPVPLNFKMGIRQRIVQGRRDSLRIKIVLLSGYNENGNDDVPGLNDEHVAEVPIQRKLRYFLYDDEMMWKRVWKKKVPFFFTNVAPDEEIYDQVAGDAYDHAWGAMQPWLFYNLIAE